MITCDDFRALTEKGFGSLTRAERSALLTHQWACRPCKDFAMDFWEEKAASFPPEVVEEAIRQAREIARDDFRDPEFAWREKP